MRGTKAIGSPESCLTPEHLRARSSSKSFKNVSVEKVSVSAMPGLSGVVRVTT